MKVAHGKKESTALWTDVSFSIDGRPIDVSGATYEENADVDYGV